MPVSALPCPHGAPPPPLLLRLTTKVTTNPLICGFLPAGTHTEPFSRIVDFTSTPFQTSFQRVPLNVPPTMRYVLMLVSQQISSEVHACPTVPQSWSKPFTEIRANSISSTCFLLRLSPRTKRTILSTAVLDLIETDNDYVAFIVMEQWSSQLIDDDGPCCLREFLAALRQCLEHVCFMHKHRIAHLDISLRNLLTDYKGHYAFIDYEMSRRFDAVDSMRFQNFRSTEVPPECEHGECREPFKADVWALAVLILRACKLAGYCIPELLQFTRPMLDSNPQTRPSMPQVLAAFEKMASSISGLDRLPSRQ
ncbi:Protein kinase domain-containing protein [Mycena chlorophos]|uniref:Protein kinase domain-containing protein n=1 Tax=Mycena chlorophos TaxID=658473 RepID=A0A8H6TPX1_MYCCL|nr:Protein kinase domain-containing protein [Mycena chlorophos]